MNKKKTVLLTWQNPWNYDIPEHVVFKQIPLTATESLDCPHLLTDLLQKKDFSRCHCLLFFSKAGVQGFQDNCPADFDMSEVRAAAVGPETAESLKKMGISPIFTGNSTGLALVQHLVGQNEAEIYVMLSGNLGGQDVEDYLSSKSVTYIRQKVYRNTEPEGAQEQLNKCLSEFSAICLASPSAAQRLLEARQGQNMPLLLSIGPKTSKCISAFGFEVAWQAAEPGYISFLNGIKKCLTK